MCRKRQGLPNYKAALKASGQHTGSCVESIAADSACINRSAEKTRGHVRCDKGMMAVFLLCHRPSAAKERAKGNACACLQGGLFGLSAHVFLAGQPALTLFSSGGQKTAWAGNAFGEPFAASGKALSAYAFPSCSPVSPKATGLC